MFPFLQWIQETRFPIEGDLNLPWAQVKVPVEGDLNLPWSNVAFYWPFSNIDNRLPLSGAVNQNIETDWTMNDDDAALNKALFEKAGPWGNQLATMMDAMEALFDKLPMDRKALTDDPEKQAALDDFQKLHATVKQVRADHASHRMAATKAAMDGLMEKDPEQAAALIRAYARRNGIALAEDEAAPETAARLPKPE